MVLVLALATIINGSKRMKTLKIADVGPESFSLGLPLGSADLRMPQTVNLPSTTPGSQDIDVLIDRSASTGIFFESFSKYIKRVSWKMFRVSFLKLLCEHLGLNQTSPLESYQILFAIVASLDVVISFRFMTKAQLEFLSQSSNGITYVLMKVLAGAMLIFNLTLGYPNIFSFKSAMASILTSIFFDFLLSLLLKNIISKHSDNQEFST